MSLIEDAKNKNPDAFEQLIQPQLQRMYRVAISMLHNEEDAADAIQETVLKCWQKIGQLKSEEYLGTWLTRILINQCKDILKERKKVVPLEEFPELIHEDHYFTNEWRKILSNLNGKYQVVMELYYVDGFSTKEIARMLHITEVNVRSRMVRGRKNGQRKTAFCQVNFKKPVRMRSAHLSILSLSILPYPAPVPAAKAVCRTPPPASAGRIKSPVHRYNYSLTGTPSVLPSPHLQ